MSEICAFLGRDRLGVEQGKTDILDNSGRTEVAGKSGKPGETTANRTLTTKQGQIGHIRSYPPKSTQYVQYWEKSHPIGHTGANMDKLAEMMAEAAETDLGLPFSLIQDAWDNVESSLLPDEKFTPTQMRAIFRVCLKEAVQTFSADQINYTFNPKAV